MSRPASPDPRPWGTAEDLPAAWRYRDWIADLVEPHLGARPLLVAAGAGDYAQAWADRGFSVTVTEEDPRLVAALRDRFADHPDIEVRQLELPASRPGNPCHTAVIALNVLEHVPDDEAVLRSLRDLVEPGGAVIVMVPAFAVAMSRFERGIGHLRRYRLRDVVQLAGRAGLTVRDVRYFNSLGLVAWIAGVRLLRLTPKPGPMLRAWDALGVSALRRLEDRWVPPFGKEVLLVGVVGDAA